MQLVDTTKAHRETFAKDIAQLVWATGPISYRYHFADKNLFDAIVLGSWQQDGTLFGADTTTLALEDGQLMASAMNTAREQGFAKLQLDVLSDNPAVEFYRAVGFELQAETCAPKPSAFGIPAEYRMGVKL